MRGKNKKGFSQIDWAISLGIFLLYIVWFFVFIKPQIVKTVDFTPLAPEIKENLKNDVYWSVYQKPVFIKTYENRSSQIIQFNFTPKYGENNFALANNKDFFYQNNRLYFLDDYTNSTNILWIIEANYTFSHINQKTDIIGNNNTISTSKNFTIKSSDGLMQNATYKSNTRLYNTRFRLENSALIKKNVTYNDKGIVFEEIFNSQRISIHTGVFSKNSVILLSTKKNDLDYAKRLVIETQINEMTKFYSDNNYFGNVSTDCDSYNNNYLKMYDNTDAILFNLPNNTRIELCKGESYSNLTLTFPNNEYNNAFIIFDSNNYENINFTDYMLKDGLRNEFKGIKLENLNNLNYSSKKIDWGLPYDKNFQIIIWNNTLNNLERNTTLLVLGDYPKTSSEVYADEYRDYLLNSNGELSEVTVNLKIW